VLDAANAAYAAMLRCLVQLYETPVVRASERQALLAAAMACMKVMTVLGTHLTELPAADGAASPRAGMSFAMLRATEGPVTDTALPALAERLVEIAERVPTLGLADAPAAAAAGELGRAAEALRRAG
jgi:hypothetical protein